MLTVICNVYMGLVTGAILKYISSVVKAFTTAASLVITSIISSFVFNMELSLPFDLAVINLAVAVYLYKTAPVPKLSPKQVPVSMEMEEIPSEIPGIDSVVADSIQIGEDEDEIVIRKFKECSCFFHVFQQRILNHLDVLDLLTRLRDGICGD